MYKRVNNWYNRQHQVLQFIILVIIVFLIRTFFFGLYQVPTGSMETTMLVGERFFADKLTVWFTPIKRGDIISFNDPNFEYSDNTLTNFWQRYVWGPSNWTKRVIGIPGDHVVGKIEEGKPVVYRNGERLHEPYLNKYPIIAVWKSEPYLYNGMWFADGYSYKSYDPNVSYADQPFYKLDPMYIANNPRITKIYYPQTPYPGDIDTFDVTLGDNEYWVMGDNRLGSYDSRGWGKLDGKLIHGKILFRFFSLDTAENWTDWLPIDLVLHPVEFFKRIRWSRCLQFVH